MDKNLPTHLFRPVDEIVRLVPIPGINISFAFIKIVEIIPCPDDQIFPGHSRWSLVLGSWVWREQFCHLQSVSKRSKAHFSRSVSSTSHSLMFRYLNTAGKKLSISLKREIFNDQSIWQQDLPCYVENMRHTVAIQFFQVGSIPFAENIVDIIWGICGTKKICWYMHPIMWGICRDKKILCTFPKIENQKS